MAISTVPSTDSINYVGSANTDSSSGVSIGTDTFLQLLVAQLKYQDPLEPQTDTSFVTQLAQMTTMEQMQQMNSTLTGSQAYDLLGKYVYAEVLDEDSGVTNGYLGLAESVILKDGIPYVLIGSSAVAVSDVVEVYDSSVFETALEAAADTATEVLADTADEVTAEVPVQDVAAETEDAASADTTV